MGIICLFMGALFLERLFDIEFELIEPIRELFKDEVRELGEEVGLPEHFI